MLYMKQHATFQISMRPNIFLCRMGGKPIMFLDSVLLQAFPGFLFCPQIQYSRANYQTQTNFALQPSVVLQIFTSCLLRRIKKNAAFGRE